MKRIILYVDDDKNDALFVDRAIKKEKLPAELFTVREACDAADWLTGAGMFADPGKYPRPDVLIVDLRMPRSSGFDLLEFIHARRALQKIPVIVYSDSENPADKLRAFQLGANAYVTKAWGMDELMSYVRSAVTTLPK
ncbi:MAG: response regulator [Limisphaerales bacterium]